MENKYYDYLTFRMRIKRHCYLPFCSGPIIPLSQPEVRQKFLPQPEVRNSGEICQTVARTIKRAKPADRGIKIAQTEVRKSIMDPLRTIKGMDLFT